MDSKAASRPEQAANDPGAASAPRSFSVGAAESRTLPPAAGERDPPLKNMKSDVDKRSAASRVHRPKAYLSQKWESLRKFVRGDENAGAYTPVSKSSPEKGIIRKKIDKQEAVVQTPTASSKEQKLTEELPHGYPSRQNSKLFKVQGLLSPRPLIKMTEEVVGSPYSAPHGAKTMRGALNPVEAPLGPVAPGRRESDVSEHLGESLPRPHSPKLRDGDVPETPAELPPALHASESRGSDVSEHLGESSPGPHAPELWDSDVPENLVESEPGRDAPESRSSDVSEHLGESSAGLGVPEKSSRASTSSAGEKRSIILPEKDVVVAKWMFDVEEYDRTIADVSIYRGTNEFQSLINANTIGGLEGATEVDSVIFSAKHDSSENVYLALRNEKKKKLGEGQTTAGRIPSEIVDKLEKDKIANKEALEAEDQLLYRYSTSAVAMAKADACANWEFVGTGDPRAVGDAPNDNAKPEEGLYLRRREDGEYDLRDHDREVVAFPVSYDERSGGVTVVGKYIGNAAEVSDSDGKLVSDKRIYYGGEWSNAEDVWNMVFTHALSNSVGNRGHSAELWLKSSQISEDEELEPAFRAFEKIKRRITVRPGDLEYDEVRKNITADAKWDDDKALQLVGDPREITIMQGEDVLAGPLDISSDASLRDVSQFLQNWKVSRWGVTGIEEAPPAIPGSGRREQLSEEESLADLVARSGYILKAWSNEEPEEKAKANSEEKPKPYSTVVNDEYNPQLRDLMKQGISARLDRIAASRKSIDAQTANPSRSVSSLGSYEPREGSVREETEADRASIISDVDEAFAFEPEPSFLLQMQQSPSSTEELRRAALGPHSLGEGSSSQSQSSQGLSATEARDALRQAAGGSRPPEDVGRTR